MAKLHRGGFASNGAPPFTFSRFVFDPVPCEPSVVPRSSCSQLSGSPLPQSSCRVAALLLLPSCQGGGVALALAPYIHWIRAAVTTDMLRWGHALVSCS